MLATHWMKSAALLLYLLGILFIMHQCTHVFDGGTRRPKPTLSVRDPHQDLPQAITREEREREERRQQHERETAQRRATQKAREAALHTMRTTDLPRAIDEYAKEALRYRNKLSDLARLSPSEQSERETPVKDARTYAYKLVLDYQSLDRDAQKGREGPTDYLDDEVALFMQRLTEFSNTRKDIADFAALLPRFVGCVPEGLILQGIDAIALAVLPADAFLACPDCPPAAQTPRMFRRVKTSAHLSDRVLRLWPHPRERIAGQLAPGAIVEVTGRSAVAYDEQPGVPITSLEILSGTNQKPMWALEKIFEPLEQKPAPAPVPKPKPAKRNSDYFSGLFGN
jgi:hypothetical protein